MGLSIDVTEMKSRDLIRVLQLYPYGGLEIKHERVFWVSDTTEPELPRQSPGEAPRRGSPPKEDWGNRFRKMQDSLGSMVGPAR